METIRNIRLAADGGGKSFRQIAKDLNLSRNTVRKVLRSDATQFEYHRGLLSSAQVGAVRCGTFILARSRSAGASQATTHGPAVV